MTRSVTSPSTPQAGSAKPRAPNQALEAALNALARMKNEYVSRTASRPIGTSAIGSDGADRQLAPGAPGAAALQYPDVREKRRQNPAMVGIRPLIGRR
jgi:hypothetical protein